MAGEIDNINFKAIINDQEFTQKIHNMEAEAKKFNVAVSQLLDLQKKASAANASSTRESVKLTEQQRKSEERVSQAVERTNAARIKGQQQAQREMAKTATAAVVNAEKEEQAIIRTQTAQERLNRLKNGGNQSLIESNKLLRELAGYGAAFFSVKTVASFVSSLIRVSGEFELQHQTLRAILGDLDGADQIFGQLQTLAVKSPFSFADLTSYAKQLSAFSIPMEELYDTTKMLADVSAGLGVDMGRVILAYGQIRSASFLRGQEVRQLTEAGIPILTELAKQFEEIEGRVVSVGEVFDKISMREVPFEMVAKVFKDMTSEGGKFYNMQEVQAETLKAKVKNLGDQYNIMLYQIGQAHDGLLKWSVNLIASLMSHWQGIGKAIVSAAAGLGVYSAALAAYAAWQKGVKLKNTIDQIAKLTSQFGSLRKGVLAYAAAAQKAGTMTKLAFAGTILGIITTVSVAIFEIVRGLGEMDRALDKIVNEKMSAAEKSISTLDEIVERLSLATKGSQNYRDALHELNSKYGDYLPNLLTEKNSLDEIKIAADNAAEAIRNKARASAVAAGEEKLEEKYGTKMEKARDAFIRDLKRGDKAIDDKAAEDIFSLFRNNIESGAYSGSAGALNAAIDAVRSYTGKDAFAAASNLYGYMGGSVQDYYNAWKTFNKKREQLERRLDGYDSVIPQTQAEREGYDAIEEYYKDRENQIRQAVLSEEEVTDQLEDLNKQRLKNLILFYGGNDITLGGKAITGVNRPELVKKAKNELSGLDYHVSGGARLVQDALAAVGITRKTSAFGLWADESTDFSQSGYYKELDNQYKDVIPNITRAKERFKVLVGTAFDSTDYDSLNEEGKRAYESIKTLKLREDAIRKIAEALGYNLGDASTKTKITGASKKSSGEDPRLTALKDEKEQIEAIRKTYEALRPYLNEDNVTMRKTLSGLYPNMDESLLSTLDFDAALKKVADDMDKYGEAGKKAGDAIRTALVVKSSEDGAKEKLNEYEASAKALEKVDALLKEILETQRDISGEDIGLAVGRVVDDLRIKDNKIDSKANERRQTIAAAELEYIELHGKAAWEQYRDSSLKAVDDWAGAEKKANHDIAQDRIKELGSNFVKKYLKENGADTERLDKQTLKQLDNILATIGDLLSDEDIAAFIPQEVIDKANELGITVQDTLGNIKAARNALRDQVDEKKWEKIKTIIDGVSSSVQKLGDAISDFGGAAGGIGAAVSALGTLGSGISEFLSLRTKGTEERIAGYASMAIEGTAQVLSTVGQQIDANREAQEAWNQTVLECEFAYQSLMLDRLDYEESNVFDVEDPLAKARAGAEQYKAALNDMLKLRDKLEEGNVQTGTKKVVSGKNTIAGASGGALAGLGTVGSLVATGAATGTLAGPLGAAIGAAAGLVVGGLASLFGAKKTVAVYENLLDHYGSVLDQSEGAGLFDLNPQIIADYKKLDDETKMIVDQWNDVKSKLEEAEQTLKDTIEEWTGDIGDQLRDSLIEAFRNGDLYSAIDNFHDYMTSTLEDLLAQTAFAAVFQDQFDRLQQNLHDSIYDPEKVGGKTWEQLLAEFGSNLEGGSELMFQMLQNMKEWGEQNGYDLFSPDESDSGLSSGLSSMTEDTANLLASYINAIRADVSVMRIAQSQGWLDVKAIRSLMPSPTVWEYVAKIEAHTFDIAQTNARIAANGAAMLSELRSVITTTGGAPAVLAYVQ